MKVKKLSKEVTKEYEEHSENYKILFGHFVKTITYKDVLKYGLGFKENDYSFKWSNYMYDEKINREFLQDLYI